MSNKWLWLTIGVVAVGGLLAGCGAGGGGLPGGHSKIAFYGWDTLNGVYNTDIYVMNSNGTGQMNITNNEADDRHPSWSPDGGKIAFASQRDGNYEVYTMNADGSGTIRLTTNAAADYEPTWSPDGSRIAFESGRDGVPNWEIYVMNADGTGQRNLTNNPTPSRDPAWSPELR